MTTLKRLQRGLVEVENELMKNIEIAECERLIARLGDNGNLGRLGKELETRMNAVDMVIPQIYLTVVAAASADAKLDEKLEKVAEALAEEASKNAIPKPRFGIKTMSTARETLEHLHRLRQRSQRIKESLAPTAQFLARQSAQDAQAAANAANAAMDFLQKNRNIVKHTTKKQLTTLNQATDTDLASVAAQKERRLRRAQEKRAKIAASNATEISIPALEQALAQLPTKIIIALTHLIASITAAPDDENRRCLRCSNVKFAADFGRPLESRVTCAFFALGFRLVYRPKSSDYIQLSQDNDNNDDDDDDDDEEPYLVLREPDPMTDLDAWSAWYDHLTACNNLLQQRHEHAASQLPTAYLPGKPPTWATTTATA